MTDKNFAKAIVAKIMAERAIKDGVGFFEDVDYSPHAPTTRQKMFLDLDHELEVFYGGAAGGGKSDALLMAALKYVHIPGYAALLLRRTYVDLARPGALMDRSLSWLNGKAHWSAQEKRWTFPSGATLTFGYLEAENDKLQYQSSEFQFIGFDELTHFTETQYTYLFSRLRRLKDATLPLRMRSASNPGGTGGMWVKSRFIPDSFTPADAVEEKVWVKKDYDQENGDEIRRFFVPARLDDNPHLDAEGYERSLRELDPITRAQLRKGDWQITAQGDILYMWSEAHHVIPWSAFRKVFGVDGDHVPKHWQLGVFQDWGTTPEHPCMTGFFATAAENSPIVNGVPLAGSVFYYRSMHDVKSTAREVKARIYEAMSRHQEIPRARLWQMSHEASSERLEYVNTSPDMPYSLPFTNWQTGKTRGIEQLKHALSLRDQDRPHPFNEGVKGRPLLYIIVDDDQIGSPRDERGMLRIRQEAPAYRWDTPKSGEPPKKLVPYALFNDAIDVVRAAAAVYWPRVEEYSRDEVVRAKLQSVMAFDIDTPVNELGEGSQLALQLMAAKMRKEEGDELFDDVESDGTRLIDITGGW